jgi:Lamin Tail Domain
LRIALLAGLALALVSAAPAAADVRINEIESNDAAGGSDWVELYNTGAAQSIAGFQLKDSGEGNTITIPAATTLPAGGYAAINVTGLGNPDTVRLFDGVAAAAIDSYAYAAHAGVTYGRCPDGTGAFVNTYKATPGAANACGSVDWPGPANAITALDAGADIIPTNFSGLAYQPSGTRAKGVLWGVQNNPGTLFRFVPSGANWTFNGGGGYSRTLRYLNGTGNPDAEGVTLADGDANAVYVSTERDGNGPSKPAVLRYDVSQAGPTLTATHQWELLGDLPGLDPNGSLEAISWVPDSFLVTKGLIDESTGVKYKPGDYPLHGKGLFFVGIEQDGRVLAYALNSDNTAKKIATIDSGLAAVMDLEFEPESGHLWAVCDDTCDGRSTTLDIAASGKFAAGAVYSRPVGMENRNNEGFAIAPQLECVNGKKPTFYSDDTPGGGNALRGGMKNCTVVPDENPGDPKVTPTPQPSTPQVTPTPIAQPVDRTAPSLKLSLKATKTVRTKGAFSVTVTLGEKADLTITATARKSAKAKARTILKSTKKGVAAGKPTLKFTLTKKVRKALKKGETLTVTVVARDAAGNATTKTAKVKVK